MNRPLDKQEALAYGQFVAAAYTMFCNEEHNLTPLPSDDFPQSWQLSAWIQIASSNRTSDSDHPSYRNGLNPSVFQKYTGLMARCYSRSCARNEQKLKHFIARMAGRMSSFAPPGSLALPKAM